MGNASSQDGGLAAGGSTARAYHLDLHWKGEVRGLATSPSTGLVYASLGRGVVEIDLSTHTQIEYAGKVELKGRTNGHRTNEAKFLRPAGLCFTQRSTMLICDNLDCTIRELADDHVSLFAGQGHRGRKDGSRLVLASFAGPTGITRIGPLIFVTETSVNVIRIISELSDLVTTLGTLDSVLVLSNPLHSSFVDNDSSQILPLNYTGPTWTGDFKKRRDKDDIIIFSSVSGISSSGHLLYVANSGNDTVQVIDTQLLEIDTPQRYATYGTRPIGLAASTSKSGTLYMCESNTHRIVKLEDVGLQRGKRSSRSVIVETSPSNSPLFVAHSALLASLIWSERNLPRLSYLDLHERSWLVQDSSLETQVFENRDENTSHLASWSNSRLSMQLQSVPPQSSTSSINSNPAYQSRSHATTTKPVRTPTVSGDSVSNFMPHGHLKNIWEQLCGVEIFNELQIASIPVPIKPTLLRLALPQASDQLLESVIKHSTAPLIVIQSTIAYLCGSVDLLPPYCKDSKLVSCTEITSFIHLLTQLTLPKHHPTVTSCFERLQSMLNSEEWSLAADLLLHLASTIGTKHWITQKVVELLILDSHPLIKVDPLLLKLKFVDFSSPISNLISETSVEIHKDETTYPSSTVSSKNKHCQNNSPELEWTHPLFQGLLASLSTLNWVDIPDPKKSSSRSGSKEFIDLPALDNSKTGDIPVPNVFRFEIKGYKKTISAYSVLVYAQWPYFRTLLESGLAEARSGVVELPEDFPPRFLELLLKWMYCGPRGWKGLEPLSLKDCQWLHENGMLFGFCDSKSKPAENFLSLDSYCTLLTKQPLCIENALPMLRYHFSILRIGNHKEADDSKERLHIFSILFFIQSHLSDYTALESSSSELEQFLTEITTEKTFDYGHNLIDTMLGMLRKLTTSPT